MDKLVVQNSMYENYFKPLDNQNLNILFSLSGNITKLMNHSVQENLNLYCKMKKLEIINNFIDMSGI